MKQETEVNILIQIIVITLIIVAPLVIYYMNRDFRNAIKTSAVGFIVCVFLVSVRSMLFPEKQNRKKVRV